MKNNLKNAGSKPLINAKYHHLVNAIIIFLCLIIFFAPIVFDKKIFVSGDSLAGHSWDTILKESKALGIFPLWNPYIFCGMPSYASLMMSGDRFHDFSSMILNYSANIFQFISLNAYQGWVFFYYFVFAFGIYFFTYKKLNNKPVALIAAVGALFSTYFMVWIMISHLTKMAVICWFPWILLCIDKLKEKFEWKIFFILTLIIHFSFIPSHMQMIFYIFFAIGIYLLYDLIIAFIKKIDWKPVTKIILTITLAMCLALAMNADQYLSVFEYSSYSIRGSAPIVADTSSTTPQSGLDYDYATSWSFSPGEIMTFIIPSWYGFGPHEYKGVLTQNQPYRINTYFGPQPFVDGPQYMGIIILIFAVIGIIRYRKDIFIQYSTIIIILSLLISFGKEMPLIYDLMFKYFPMFNKFRVPVMILVLMQILIPILAAYGIMSFLNQKENKKVAEKKLLVALAWLGGILIFSIIARSVIVSIYESFFPLSDIGNKLARTIGTADSGVLSEIYNFITNSILNDIYVALALTIASLGSIYLYLKGNLKITTVYVVIFIAVIFDLWRVDKKPMEPQDNFSQAGIFNTPDYVSFLKKDNSYYRVLEFENGQPPYSNMLAYWKIQSAYGYQGVKMRQIQDMFDVVGLGNPLLWGLMNVKYIITDRPDSNHILLPIYKGQKKYILYNKAELPRAFFVNRYDVAKGIELLNKIKNIDFNPTDVAYFLEDPKIKIDPPSQNANAKIVKYNLHEVELDVEASGNNLLFISESWYPVGWKAYIDGSETKIHRLNYMFRGIIVPEGNHKISMTFAPKGFAVGKIISLLLNIIFIGGFVLILYKNYTDKKKKDKQLHNNKENK